jgi:predicted 3-demethylubiquinone-9 3-methyltransferase (glyoxalase superfamily)
VSWQIVPSALGEMLHGAEAEKTDSVMKAVLQMDKLEVDLLQQAYERA